MAKTLNLIGGNYLKTTPPPPLLGVFHCVSVWVCYLSQVKFVTGYKGWITQVLQGWVSKGAKSPCHVIRHDGVQCVEWVYSILFFTFLTLSVIHCGHSCRYPVSIFATACLQWAGVSVTWAPLHDTAFRYWSARPILTDLCYPDLFSLPLYKHVHSRSCLPRQFGVANWV